MFTGIIERMGRVVYLGRSDGKALSLEIDLGETSNDAEVGDSVAVNGACLSITSKCDRVASFDVIEETLHKTNLGELSPGSEVNLERSMLLSDRIDGHLVSGHVDGVGRITRTEELGDGSIKMWVDAPGDLTSFMVHKGSVALDGVSLTLVEIADNSFSVCLIPQTLAHTTLGFKRPEDHVNIEVDMIGKFVKRFLQQMGGGPPKSV